MIVPLSFFFLSFFLELENWNRLFRLVLFFFGVLCKIDVYREREKKQSSFTQFNLFSTKKMLFNIMRGIPSKKKNKIKIGRQNVISSCILLSLFFLCVRVLFLFYFIFKWINFFFCCFHSNVKYLMHLIFSSSLIFENVWLNLFILKFMYVDHSVLNKKKKQESE